MDRILGWYRVASSTGAVVALIVANAIPLFGAVFLGWNVWMILIVYWLENGIVGFFNVLKILRAEGPADPTSDWRMNGKPMAVVGRGGDRGLLRDPLRHVLVRPRDLRADDAPVRGHRERLQRGRAARTPARWCSSSMASSSPFPTGHGHDERVRARVRCCWPSSPSRSATACRSGSTTWAAVSTGGPRRRARCSCRTAGWSSCTSRSSSGAWPSPSPGRRPRRSRSSWCSRR